MMKRSQRTMPTGMTQAELGEKISNAINMAQSMGNRNAEVRGLQNLQNQMSIIDPNRVVVDLATIVLPNDSLLEFPPLYAEVRNDPFFLRCCEGETEDPVPGIPSSPCGCGPVDPVNGMEIRVTGHINWHLCFELETFFNNGANNCGASVPLAITATGTTCVDQQLCVDSGLNTCPDFCNENTVSFAIGCSFCEIDTKLSVTYYVVHLLPPCETTMP
ncbi:hypothetical protein ACFFIY_07735 [Bhargavaea ullalensis]|uniref:Spore coat protein Z n=1 Tax=Bhargavaea ullalensis TaxID=1265685 RepID=A0ABV2GDQ4_9BACL